MGKNKKKCIVVVLILSTLFASFFVYVENYYKAEDSIETLLAAEKDRIQKVGDFTVISPPETSRHGIVFYPGGKVEEKAYLPLLLQLSEEGITCVLVKMPFRLAVLDKNRGEKVYSLLPKIENWYLMGHSLGGVMASSYLEDTKKDIEGLILLGAYPMNQDAKRSLVIYGTEDIQLDLEKVAEADEVFSIPGGNHAYFGNYGEQKGDGVATISREDQQRLTVEKIKEFVLGK